MDQIQAAFELKQILKKLQETDVKNRELELALNHLEKSIGWLLKSKCKD